MTQENFILIISSPSGAGKTSIAKKIIALNNNKFLSSISVTTRAKRNSEEDGKDYFFVTKEIFKEMLMQNKFLEYTEIFDNYYASPKDFIIEKLSEGYNILFDIDFNGAASIKEKLGNLVVSIFILPPSFAELEKRLKNRQENSEEEIEKRLKNSPLEISNYKFYDYVLINENFEETITNVQTIINAEIIKRRDLTKIISNL